MLSNKKNSPKTIKLSRLLPLIKLLSIFILILLTIFPNVGVYASTDPEREDVQRRSEWDDQVSRDCSSSSTAEAVSGDNDSGQRIGYHSGLEEPYILEQFEIHSLKALAQAKNIPESDTVTEEHVIALVAFAIGEGGDIQNGNIFNPLNHGKIKDDNGTLTGDGRSGFVKYSNFDDGVDANARVLNGSLQQRVSTALSDPNITAYQFMEKLSYWAEYPGDHYWAEASGSGTRSDPVTNDYFKSRKRLVDQVRSNWEGTAGLQIGTEDQEQDTGAEIPSKLTYHPVGSATGGADTPVSDSSPSQPCSADTTADVQAPDIDTTKKDTFNIGPDGNKRPTITPTGVVLHWTAGSQNDTVDEFIEGIKSNKACGELGCSVQFFVDGKGKIYQLVDPINTLAAHAAGANSCCIGIEIAGRGEDDLEGNAGQKQSVINLTAYLVSRFDMQTTPDVAGLKGVLSHHITPKGIENGKSDVGDKYWLDVVNAVRSSQSTTTNLDQTKKDWLKKAGIPESDWENVDKIIKPESGWNPKAQNPQSSAYGLAQFLDDTWGSVGCAKTDDPVEQLRCADLYVKQRYEGWAGAVKYREKNGSY